MLQENNPDATCMSLSYHVCTSWHLVVVLAMYMSVSKLVVKELLSLG